jgi:hypothetical protein
MSVTSSITAGGNIGFTYSQGTVRSLWGGGYGGVVQIVSDNATSSRYVRIGLSDSNNSWIGGLTIDNNYLASFSGAVSAATYLGVSKDGSDTIGSGPYLVLSQTANSRQWIQQMSASLSLNFYHYNGSAWIQPLTLTATGTATFSSSVTATNAVFTNDGSSRVMYLRGSGNIIQFQDGNSVNKWEVVGREGTFYIYKNDGTGTGYVYQINSSGAHTITGAASFSSTVTVSGTLTENSSLRYKENIETIKYGLDKVVQMRGVSYTKKDTGAKEIGLIAEELNEIIPDLVIKNQEGEADSVSYGRITAVLIEAIKELKMEIEELKRR